MKKLFAVLGFGLILAACSTGSKVMQPDDGTVNGSTVEDAGGDGTNTTGGSMNYSSQSSAAMQMSAHMSLKAGAFSSSFPTY